MIGITTQSLHSHRVNAHWITLTVHIQVMLCFVYLYNSIIIKISTVNLVLHWLK